jgi:hypothetical protein
VRVAELEEQVDALRQQLRQADVSGSIAPLEGQLTPAQAALAALSMSQPSAAQETGADVPGQLGASAGAALPSGSAEPPLDAAAFLRDRAAAAEARAAALDAVLGAVLVATGGPAKQPLGTRSGEAIDSAPTLVRSLFLLASASCAAFAASFDWHLTISSQSLEARCALHWMHPCHDAEIC